MQFVTQESKVSIKEADKFPDFLYACFLKLPMQM